MTIPPTDERLPQFRGGASSPSVCPSRTDGADRLRCFPEPGLSFPAVCVFVCSYRVNESVKTGRQTAAL